jgi:hypothetical protein
MDWIWPTVRFHWPGLEAKVDQPLPLLVTQQPRRGAAVDARRSRTRGVPLARRGWRGLTGASGRWWGGKTSGATKFVSTATLDSGRRRRQRCPTVSKSRGEGEAPTDWSNRRWKEALTEGGERRRRKPKIDVIISAYKWMKNCRYFIHVNWRGWDGTIP